MNDIEVSLRKTKWLKTGVLCLLAASAWFVFAAAQNGQFQYDSLGFRNPIIPLVTPEGRILQLDKKPEQSKGIFALEGIIFDPYGVSYAIVNGMIVKTGDRIGDSQVLKIEKNRLMCIKDGQISVIELKKEGRREEQTEDRPR
jgi:hypothetical protein